MAKPGRGVGQHQPLDPLRRMQRQPLADDPAQGQAEEMRAPYLQRVEQLQYVLAQPGQGIGPRRHAGGAMATGVVAQDAEVPGQCRELCIPHVQGGTDGVGERQQRFLRRTVQAIGEAGAIASSEKRQVAHGSLRGQGDCHARQASCDGPWEKLQRMERLCQGS
ncbi:hypothetical protein Z046_00115 [Pseudomonas aeruginosa VRFPA09]|nr:hypothetical protein Z046_00115 [Pseudomonas aeruginosa VRFPA09]